jgi:purine-binding chemotaxis protein CheW
MSTMLLVVSVAGRQAALPALEVKAVVELPSVTPVPCAPPHVAGLAALRSRPMTVIDCNAVIDRHSAAGDRAAGDRAEAGRAVVVEHAGHLYALLVETADAIVEARSELLPLGADPGPGWRQVALGWIETETGGLPLLDRAELTAGNAA